MQISAYSNRERKNIKHSAQFSFLALRFHLKSINITIQISCSCSVKHKYLVQKDFAKIE